MICIVGGSFFLHLKLRATNINTLLEVMQLFFCSFYHLKWQNLIILIIMFVSRLLIHIWGTVIVPTHCLVVHQMWLVPGCCKLGWCKFVGDVRLAKYECIWQHNLVCHSHWRCHRSFVWYFVKCCWKVKIVKMTRSTALSLSATCTQTIIRAKKISKLVRRYVCFYIYVRSHVLVKQIWLV